MLFQLPVSTTIILFISSQSYHVHIYELSHGYLVLFFFPMLFFYFFFGNTQRQFIARRMIPKIFSKNENLIVQNTTGQGLYIIVCGTCVVEQELPGEQGGGEQGGGEQGGGGGGGGGEQTAGTKERLTTLYPGHFVGEMSLMDKTESWTVASVIATCPVTTMFFCRKDALILLDQETSFRHALSAEIHQRSTLARRRKSIQGNTSSSGGGGGENGEASETSTSMYRSASMQRMDEYYEQKKLNSNPRKIRHSTSVKKSKSTIMSTGNNSKRQKINIINGYKVGTTLGQGSYGKVKLVEDQVTGLKYAMKIINRSILKRLNNKKQIKETKNEKDILLREVSLMKQMRHPNIVNLIEVIDDPSHDRLYIISEFCGGGPIMKTFDALDINDVRNF